MEGDYCAEREGGFNFDTTMYILACENGTLHRNKSLLLEIKDFLQEDNKESDSRKKSELEKLA